MIIFSNISLNSTRPTNSYGGFLNLDPTKQRDVELKLLENPKATKVGVYFSLSKSPFWFYIEKLKVLVEQVLQSQN